MLLRFFLAFFKLDIIFYSETNNLDIIKGCILNPGLEFFPCPEFSIQPNNLNLTLIDNNYLMNLLYIKNYFAIIIKYR